jgi:spore photoproduct lyase
VNNQKMEWMSDDISRWLSDEIKEVILEDFLRFSQNKFLRFSVADFPSIYWELFKEEFKNNLIVAITFSPQEIIEKFEWWTASLDDRIEFAKFVQSKWFQIWIRIDPIIFYKSNFEDNWAIYENLLDKLLSQLDSKLIFNWWIGILRLKKSLYSKLKKIGSDLVNNLNLDNWFYRYKIQRRKEIYNRFYKKIWNMKLYVCMDNLY